MHRLQILYVENCLLTLKFSDGLLLWLRGLPRYIVLKCMDLGQIKRDGRVGVGGDSEVLKST